MLKVTPVLLALTLSLVGCGTVPIDRVERDELTVTVHYRHLPNRVELNTEFRTGFWDRRVDAGTNRPEVITQGGEVRRLNRGSEDGQYRLELDPASGPFHLKLPDFAEMELPVGETVRLRGIDSIQGQTFERDDELTLSVRGTTERPRGWSFTVQCGRDTWTVNRSLGSGDTELNVHLGKWMRQINNVAEADLSGRIPVTITLWERYDVDWQPPFKPGTARAEDRVNFEVDIERSRVQMGVRANVQVSQNLFLGFQNLAWPVRHCS